MDRDSIERLPPENLIHPSRQAYVGEGVPYEESRRQWEILVKEIPRPGRREP